MLTLSSPRLMTREYEPNPSFVITHRIPLQDAAEGYKTFHEKKDRCVKVVLKPHEASA